MNKNTESKNVRKALPKMKVLKNSNKFVVVGGNATPMATATPMPNTNSVMPNTPQTNAGSYGSYGSYGA